MSKKSLHYFIFGSILLLLQACSVKSETTYYKDSATSMESNIMMDKSMMGMMNMMNQSAALPGSSELAKLSTEWKSLYEIQKDGLVKLNEDSVKVLKKLFMKVSKDNGEISGLSLKYDKLLPGEVAQLLSQSRQLRNVPLQNAGKWNGKTLTIDTDKFSMGEFLSQIENAPQNTAKPTTKQDSIMQYGRQMASGMIGMMKMFNMKISSTMKFEKPIKSISGKHDYVKQLNKNTVEISVNTKDLFDENKKLRNNDKQIVVTTE